MIDTELALADLAAVEKQLANATRKVAQAGGDKEAQRMVAVLEQSARRRSTQAGRCARSSLTQGRAGGAASRCFLLTAKPTMYVANVDEHGFDEQPAPRRA